MKNFPTDPHCKNCLLSATLPKADIFYIGGLWGNSLPVVGFEWNLASEFASNLPMIEIEFELDRARIKNNIAENSFALGHETHNRQFWA